MLLLEHVRFEQRLEGGEESSKRMSVGRVLRPGKQLEQMPRGRILEEYHEDQCDESGVGSR